MKRLGGVKPFVDAREAELTVNLRKLEVEERKIRATLEELTGLEAELRSRISTLISEPVNSTIQTLADLKKTAETVKAASTQLKSEFDDPETGLKAKSREIIDRIGEDWKREGDIQVKAIKATGETVRKTISSLVGQVNDAMEASFEAGKIVGHYKHSGDLLRIMKGEPIDRLTGLITLASALQASGEWLRANGMGDLGQQFNNIARNLEGRMRA